MGNILGTTGFNGDLEAVKVPGRTHGARSVRIGKRRFFWTDDMGESTRFANQMFQTNLTAVHRDGDGKLKDMHDLGSGLVTNVGVLSLVNDWLWASPSGSAINTLKLQNYHASGTGATAAAITDIQLQTAAAPTTTTAVTGVQSAVYGSVGGDAASVQSYKTVATINYTSGLAITEWGLFNNATLSATTGTPFSGTGATSTTASVTGTPLTASSTTVQGQQQFIFKDTTAASPFWGLVISNTTSVITVPAWYVVTTGAVSAVNPVNGDAYTIQPVMWDHKIFGAINVVASDSIQFSYTVQAVSGG